MNLFTHQAALTNTSTQPLFFCPHHHQLPHPRLFWSISYRFIYKYVRLYTTRNFFKDNFFKVTIWLSKLINNDVINIREQVSICAFQLSYNFSVKCLSRDSNKSHPWQLEEVKDVICFKLSRVRQLVWTNTVDYSLLYFLLMRTTIHEVHQKAHSLGWRKIENVFAE